MKKVKLLYDVARTMKNMAKIAGVITLEVRKDQESIFSLQNNFEKDEAGKVKAQVSTRMNMNGEELTRESTTEFTHTGECHHGPCMIWKGMHGHHGPKGGHGPHGIKGFFHRISVALGLLGSLKVEERPDGAVLSLNLADVPDELKDLLRAKIREKHAGHQHFGCMQGCQDIELLNGLVVVDVNDKNAIDRLTVNLDGRTQDAESKAHALTATADLRLAW